MNTIIEALTEAAAEECLFVEGHDPPPCPEEWPTSKKNWCRSCWSRELLSLLPPEEA